MAGGKRIQLPRNRVRPVVRAKRRPEADANPAASAPTDASRKRVSSDGGRERTVHGSDSDEDMEFEDPFEDEFEDEAEAGDVEEASEEEAVEEDDMNLDDPDAEEGEEAPVRAWRPDQDDLEEGDVLEYDSHAYDMYHSMTAEWPCLSFDILHDELGLRRTRFPHTMFLAAGSQADSAKNNKIYLMRMSDLHRTKHDQDDSDMSDDDDNDDADDDPTLEVQTISHHGGVNRIRSMPQKSAILATWSDDGSVYLWDSTSALETLNHRVPSSTTATEAPIFTFTGHRSEGYSMDWSPLDAGRLLTGDCLNNIYLWEKNGSTWTVGKNAFSGHKASVEDIQWSPVQSNVFSSCSVDKTVCVWDVREHNRPMLQVEVHDSDVNVISWNRLETNLLASGADDGSFKIWDFRMFQTDRPVAHFRYHRDAITSIEWSPDEGSVLAVSSAQNQITIWDLSLEEDPEALADIPAAQRAADDAARLGDIPPQLLFVHMGQTDMKEVHWHRQIPGALVSTAGDGFNFWKPINTGLPPTQPSTASSSSTTAIPESSSSTSSTSTVRFSADTNASV